MFPSRRIILSGGDKFRDDYSVAFDGTDDYVAIGKNANLYPNDADWSISLWFKSTTTENDYLISGGDESDKGHFAFRLRGDDGGYIRTFLYDHDNSQELSFNSTATGLNDGAWHHMVYTLDWSDSKRGRVSIDGVQSQTSTNANVVTLTNDDDGIHIGKRYKQTSGTYEFTGNISDVAIYNRRLTRPEIATIYNGRQPYNHMEPTAFSPYLKGWWRMGDGTYDHFDNSLDNGTGNRGLITDESNPGFGPELMTNGGFDSDSGWTKGSGWSIGSGVATRASGESSNSSLTYNASDAVTAGNIYKYSFNANNTAGNSSLYIGGTTVDSSMDPDNASISGYVLSTNSSEVTYYGLTSMEGTLDNFSVKLVDGNPGIMVNMASADIVGDTP